MPPLAFGSNTQPMRAKSQTAQNAMFWLFSLVTLTPIIEPKVIVLLKARCVCNSQNSVRATHKSRNTGTLLDWAHTLGKDDGEKFAFHQK